MCQMHTTEHKMFHTYLLALCLGIFLTILLIHDEIAGLDTCSGWVQVSWAHLLWTVVIGLSGCINLNKSLKLKFLRPGTQCIENQEGGLQRFMRRC